MALTYTSQNPISVEKDGVTQVYDTWKVAQQQTPRLRIDQATGVIELTVGFHLWGVSPGGQPVMYPGPAAVLDVANVLTDSTLASPFVTLFGAILAKAVAAGTIS